MGFFRFELEPANRDSCWTLCVFDDDWQRAKSATEDYDLSSAEGLNKLAERYGRSPQGVGKYAVALLPYFVKYLEQLNILLVADFPNDESDLNRFLRSTVQLERTAFLVDLWESGERYPGDAVVAALKSHGVPDYRIAYFTQGARGRDELEYVVKGDLIRPTGVDPSRLQKWWQLMRDAIDYTFFKHWTRTNLAGKAHDPSHLSEISEDLDFRDFLRELAVRDKFGVWQWICSILHSDDELLEKQYAYLCGKAFLRFGQSTKLCFAALRALAHGIGNTLPAPRQVTVYDQGVPAEWQENIDGMLFCGGCQTGRKRFEKFARSLREWVSLIELGNKQSENVRLQAINVQFDGHGAQMVLQFSGSLPEEIFDGSGCGTVTGGWKGLKETLCHDAIHRSASRREVHIRFPPM